MKKKAIIIGSTGLIGNYLLELLLNDENFETILALVRQPMSSKNKKLKYLQTNFENLENISDQIQGDCLFICVGSTIAKSKTKEAFFKIDYKLPVDISALAIKNGITTCLVVSSLGANAHSSNFYLQTKGKMEHDIEKLGFKSLVFMRPSLLFGARQEFRLGELIGKFTMKLMGPLFIGPLKKYRGIEGKTVAIAMLKTSLQERSGTCIYESDKIEILAKQTQINN